MSLKPAFLASVLALVPIYAAAAQDLQQDTSPSGQSPADLFSRRPPAKAATIAPEIPRPTSGMPFVLERPKTEAEDAAPVTMPPKQVDTGALRYYASQNDLSRVSAEIRLLRAKHPNWEPPADLFSEVRNSVDEQPFWDLFAKHDLTGLKAAIDELRQSKPDWQPSSELTEKLALAEAHDAIVAASEAQRWNDVVDIATDNRALLSCTDIDALWRTAEALVRLNDEPRALDAYRYVLGNCSKPQQRLATVQKASLLLQTPGAVNELLSLGRRGRDGRNEFESIRLDTLRKMVGDAAAGKAEAQPTPRDIQTLEASYASTKLQSDAQLLGWYDYSRKEFAKAETWFRTGMSEKPQPKSAEGLTLALREQGKLQEAEDVALQNRDLDVPNRKVFIELTAALLLDPKSKVVLKPEQITAFAKAIDTAQSAEGAQAYGWRLYNSKDIAGAEAWFRKSMTWGSNEDAAVGLMISARQLRHDRDYADLVGKYRDLYPRVAELEAALRPRGAPAGRTRVAVRNGRGVRVSRTGDGWDANADSIVKTFKDGQYEQTLAMLDARKGTKGEPRGLGVIRGWAQYHRGDWAGAQQTFSALEQKAPSTDSAAGLRVIEEGYTNPRFR